MTIGIKKLDKFVIEITETLQKSVAVKASSYLDAIEKVKEKYFQGEIVLTADNAFIEAEFEVRNIITAHDDEGGESNES